MRVSLTSEAADLIDLYDVFLQKLDDHQLREYLKTVPPSNVYSDRRFMELRDLSHDFQNVLTKSFFIEDTLLRDFNIRYGVF